MFGPTATLNFGQAAPNPAEVSAEPSDAFPAAAPDGAQQLAMLSSATAPYQQIMEAPPPATGPASPNLQQQGKPRMQND